MWKGESDLATLTAGIDPESAALVRLILHADDDCYVQQHRTACDERDLAYADPAIGRAANAISEGVPETTTNATQEHVIEMFEIVQAMADHEGAWAVQWRAAQCLREMASSKVMPQHVSFNSSSALAQRLLPLAHPGARELCPCLGRAR